MSDIFNSMPGGVDDYSSVLGGVSDELVKAVIAGSQTGRDFNNVQNTGGSLKTESLDAMVRLLTSTEKHIVYWKSLNKNSVYNTVHEYNQQLDYGSDAGGFNLEGEAPQFSDPTYRRKSALIKYLGFSGEVTHPAMLVRNADGINNWAREIQNKTQLLMRFIDKQLATANSSMVSTEFDGIFQQHFQAEEVGNSSLDQYFASSQVIDARGGILTDALVQDATNAAVNTNYGFVDKIVGSPTIFNNYVKQFGGLKRFMVGQKGAITDATLGQSVAKIDTQFGAIDIMNDIFFDRKVAKDYNAAATHSKAPAAPIADVSAPTNTVTGIATSHFSGFTGTYFYGVTARNRYGESAMTLLKTTASTVANATDAVDLKFAAGSGAYAAESFIIYKTKKNEAAYTDSKAFFPVFEITAASLATGFDGAAASTVRDRNFWIPGAQSALVQVIDPEYLEYLQLAPIMKMDLAITSPSKRFMVLNYGTPAVYMPTKIIRIVNLGDIQPA
jgi:hypothetical protein